MLTRSQLPLLVLVVSALAACTQQKSQATQQQAQANTSAGQAAYGKARAACLEGKGYTVK